jgi:hypothetical protein
MGWVSNWYLNTLINSSVEIVVSKNNNDAFSTTPNPAKYDATNG